MQLNEIFNRFRDYNLNLLLTEGRVEDAIAKYPEMEQDIRFLAANDPSGNNKYLAWGVKQISGGNERDDVAEVIKDFDRSRQRLPKKDINQWEFSELRDALGNLGTSKSKKKQKQKTEGAIKLYEDDRYFLIAPLTEGASCTYGAGTKWCISAKHSNYFKQYFKYQKVSFVFALDKTKDKEDPNYKIALVYYDKNTVMQAAQMDPDKFGSLKPDVPQEIFNAVDDSVCGDPYGSNGSCSESNYLENFFDGQWESKFRKICFGGIEKTVEWKKEAFDDKKLFAKFDAYLNNPDKMFNVTLKIEDEWEDWRLVNNIKNLSIEDIGTLHYTYYPNKFNKKMILNRLSVIGASGVPTIEESYRLLGFFNQAMYLRDLYQFLFLIVKKGDQMFFNNVNTIEPYQTDLHNLFSGKQRVGGEVSEYVDSIINYTVEEYSNLVSENVSKLGISNEGVSEEAAIDFSRHFKNIVISKCESQIKLIEVETKKLKDSINSTEADLGNNALFSKFLRDAYDSGAINRENSAYYLPRFNSPYAEVQVYEPEDQEKIIESMEAMMKLDNDLQKICEMVRMQIGKGALPFTISG